jgi:hypothetical protein
MRDSCAWIPNEPSGSRVQVVASFSMNLTTSDGIFSYKLIKSSARHMKMKSKAENTTRIFISKSAGRCIFR